MADAHDELHEWFVFNTEVNDIEQSAYMCVGYVRSDTAPSGKVLAEGSVTLQTKLSIFFI